MSNKARRRPSWKKTQRYFWPKVYECKIELETMMDLLKECKEFSKHHENGRFVIVNPEIAELLIGGDFE